MKKKNTNTSKTTTKVTTKATTQTTTQTTTKNDIPFGSYGSRKTTTYTYKGVKNHTEFPEFVELCKYTQAELKQILPKRLINAGYTDVVIGDGYIYAKGTVPVLLTAHMDTVHKEPVKDFYEYIDDKRDHIISSPQGIGGDDRCGIYMILEIIKEQKCSVLFCEDEESGGQGSTKFCKTEFINELADLKYLIELDRMNGTDAVFYDCENDDFTEFITTNTGYKEAYGTFSDISHLAPACGVAAVNLSCGYYSAHTLYEEVNVEEMLNTIDVIKHLLTVESEQFEYVEARYSGYGYIYGRRYNSYYNDDYDYGYYGKSNNGYGKNIYYEEEQIVVLDVIFYDGETKQSKEEIYYGDSEGQAWFEFFKANPNTTWNMVMDYSVDYM